MGPGGAGAPAFLKRSPSAEASAQAPPGPHCESHQAGVPILPGAVGAKVTVSSHTGMLVFPEDLHNACFLK